MAERMAFNVAGRALESFTSRTWREIQYVFDYNNNIKKLKEKVKDLEDRKDTIKLEVDAAKNNAYIIGPDVLGWLEKVDNIMKEANEVLERIAHWGCLYCKCAKLQSRHKLSKQAFMKIGEVIELQDASNFERIGHPTPPGQMPWTSPQEFDGFESRMKIRDDVMEALRDNSITMIGICGMAGVGKTTLVKEIADKVKAKNLFDEVAMAVVSNHVSVANIQDQLAENLGLTIEKKTDHARAERLYTRLMNKEEKILLILDDLWQELDFRNIGIPVAAEREGLKVLLTSRYKGICEKMRARPFEVEVLSEEESWYLFNETAEIANEANNNIVKDIAKEVTKECGGLPLAIVIVAKSLKNKEDYVWREALEELKEASVTTSIPDMHNLVNSKIMLSYKYLADNTKLLLLLCSLFPEDYNIPLEDLVRYAKGLQLFKNVTRARARDKVYSITDELKSCYLLLAGDRECVKLHDVVRDVCLSIASSDEHMYMVRHAGLKGWPQEDCYTHYTAISLTFDEIDELPSGLECPKLKLLRLNFREDKLHIPEDFFKGMNELKVLGVSYLNGELPLSVQSLVNLRALCFDNCGLFGDISSIGSLKKLEILRLNLRCEEGPSLPSDVLVNLKKLEELYLDSCELEYLVDATGGGGSAFINLEQLVIENANNLVELCHGNNLPPGSFARLREVRLYEVPALRHLWGAIQHPCLSNLRILELKKCGSITSLFPQSSLKCLRQLQKISISECPRLETLVSKDDGDEKNTRDVEFPELEILELDTLESFQSFNPESEALFAKVMLANLKTLKISDMHGIRCIVDDQVPIESLSKLQTMKVSNCNGLRHVAASNSIKLLQSLERLDVQWANSLEVVFDFTGLNVKGANIENLLGQLESLELTNLINLKHICRMLPEGIHAFKNLRTLQVSYSHNLRYLLTLSMATMPVGLETLELEECGQMEAIIGSDERPILEIVPDKDIVKGKDREESTNKIVFPKLRSICVACLNNFQMLCSENMDLELPSLTILEITECPKFDLYRCSSKKVFTLVNLETLDIQFSRGISHILDDQMPIGSLPKLRTIIVMFCHDIRHVAASNSIKLLQSLERLEVSRSESLKRVFDFRGINVEGADMESLLDRLQSLKLEDLPNLKHICRMCPKEIDAFKNLRSLEVGGCNNLRYLLSPSMAKMLVGLETLYVGGCEEMEAVIGRDERLISEIESEEDTGNKKKDGEKKTHKIQFPKLRRLQVKWLYNFRMLCSENADLELPSLTEFVNDNCLRMTNFCVGQLSATRLHNVQVQHFSYDDGKSVEKNVAIADFNSWLKDCESKIRCLRCSFFRKETCEHFG